MDACSAIVEGSRRYASSIEGLAWDHVLEAAPVLQAYVLRGEAPEGVDNRWAARILWAMLAVWGNVKSLISAGSCCICCLKPWLNEGAKLVRRLRENFRNSVERLASLPEAPSPEDIDAVRRDVEKVYNIVIGTRCLGDVAAAKTIAFLTLFHLPPIDSKIVKLLTGRASLGLSAYLEALGILARLLRACMRHPVFRSYLEERRSTGSIIRGKPFKVLDEGLWWLLHKGGEEDELRGAIRAALRHG